VKDAFGGEQIIYQESTLDEGMLQKIADITGGRTYRAEDTGGLKQIYEEINNLEKSQVEVERHTRYKELMAWLLIPALGLVAGEMALRKTAFRTLP
jgi:Ca-activated chloride channel homolog